MGHTDGHRFKTGPFLRDARGGPRISWPSRFGRDPWRERRRGQSTAGLPTATTSGTLSAAAFVLRPKWIARRLVVDDDAAVRGPRAPARRLWLNVETYESAHEFSIIPA